MQDFVALVFEFDLVFRNTRVELVDKLAKFFKRLEGALENRWHLRAGCRRIGLGHHFAFVLKLELGNDSCLRCLVEDDAWPLRFLSEVADSDDEGRKK